MTTERQKKMKWWQLSLFGVGCTIGTGFFLGSSLAISTGGPLVLVDFVLAAIGTYLVFDALSKMAAGNPQKGAFRAYAKQAYGRWAGFSVGWGYWFSEMLIMGSQLTALSIFTRFWFPHIPLWVFASLYSVLGLGIVLLGTEGLNRLEDGFAVIKISAILMFLLIAAAVWLGWIDGGNADGFAQSTTAYLPRGISGLWAALIFAFYAFGGIEVMSFMAVKLRNPQEMPKAGKVMIVLLAVIYVLSIAFAVSMVSWKAFDSKESPFVIALKGYHLPFVSDLFNGALIIAGFSTMAASLFGVTTILVTLAKDGDAPRMFAREGKLKVPAPAFGLTVGGVVVSIVLSLLMPKHVYEYITTGAGIMLLYNWFFIIVSARRITDVSMVDQWKHFTGMTLILLAVFGTVFDKNSRPGLFISLLFVIIIAFAAFKMRSFRQRNRARRDKRGLLKRYKPNP
ncbi:MAG TPA: amino acid permease [Bacillales bacterium]|nr:amino acid permease [Bacillales bacterium]